MLERLKAWRASAVQWLDAHLVADWRKFWKRWSVRLALAAGTMTTIVTTNQDLFINLLNALPANSLARIALAIALGFFVAVVPTIAVLVKQDKVTEAAQAAQGPQDG